MRGRLADARRRSGLNQHQAAEDVGMKANTLSRWERGKASGDAGVPGAGTAVLLIPVPNDSTLIDLSTYWQGFVMDAMSPAPIGFSHTGGLMVTVR